MHKRLLALLVAGAFASGAALAQTPASGSMTASEVRQALTEAGYTEVRDVEFDDGLWEADATSGDGRRIDVRLDPATGKIYPDTATSALTADDIKASLTAEGYANVRDVEFDDGLWKAEADRNGRKVELRLDPEDGRVVTERDD
ncbi:PepSY domain-containing protein [Coralloluteibacterium thermophilus]|uniref:PepSY domain-containing protein n=1 Tax=Coralloluteibacterium thermophilum TaxID=2707049 RepID=A0ABV9NMK0_9GAMM